MVEADSVLKLVAHPVSCVIHAVLAVKVEMPTDDPTKLLTAALVAVMVLT